MDKVDIAPDKVLRLNNDGIREKGVTFSLSLSPLPFKTMFLQQKHMRYHCNIPYIHCIAFLHHTQSTAKRLLNISSHIFTAKLLKQEYYRSHIEIQYNANEIRSVTKIGNGPVSMLHYQTLLHKITISSSTVHAQTMLHFFILQSSSFCAVLSYCQRYHYYDYDYDCARHTSLCERCANRNSEHIWLCFMNCTSVINVPLKRTFTHNSRVGRKKIGNLKKNVSIQSSKRTNPLPLCSVGRAIQGTVFQERDVSDWVIVYKLHSDLRSSDRKEE